MYQPSHFSLWYLMLLNGIFQIYFLIIHNLTLLIPDSTWWHLMILSSIFSNLCDKSVECVAHILSSFFSLSRSSINQETEWKQDKFMFIVMIFEANICEVKNNHYTATGQVPFNSKSTWPRPEQTSVYLYALSKKGGANRIYRQKPKGSIWQIIQMYLN